LSRQGHQVWLPIEAPVAELAEQWELCQASMRTMGRILCIRNASIYAGIHSWLVLFHCLVSKSRALDDRNGQIGSLISWWLLSPTPRVLFNRRVASSGKSRLIQSSTVQWDTMGQWFSWLFFSCNSEFQLGK
jgi:hypothetical protein